MAREKFREIKARLGLRAPDVRTGSTVLSDDVREVAESLGVPWAGSIQRTWRAVIEAVGAVPDDGDTSLEGSGTITDEGFDKVLGALDDLAGAPLPEHEALRAGSQPPPSDDAEGRRRVLAEVVRRQGQPAFRRALLVAYEGRCAMTETAEPPALEAAHIRPYAGVATNAVTNGLLLRSDVHVLFDLGLIAVGEGYRIETSGRLRDTSYRMLAGRRLMLPAEERSWPDPGALAEHRAASQI